MEHRLHGMAEQGTKLETMVLHLAREQERYLEPARQHLFRHRRSSSLLSQSQPSLVRLEHFDEEDGEGPTDSRRCCMLNILHCCSIACIVSRSFVFRVYGRFLVMYITVHVPLLLQVAIIDLATYLLVPP